MKIVLYSNPNNRLLQILKRLSNVQKNFLFSGPALESSKSIGSRSIAQVKKTTLDSLENLHLIEASLMWIKFFHHKLINSV